MDVSTASSSVTASCDALPTPYKILHFQEQPPRPKTLSKENSCHICYAGFSYTAWRYDCIYCNHSFCSQHGRESNSLLNSKQDEVRQNVCIECFVPRRLAALEDSIFQISENNRNKQDCSWLKDTSEYPATGNKTLAKENSTTGNKLANSASHEKLLTIAAADPNKSLIANVESRRSHRDQEDITGSGARAMGLLAAAVTSPVHVGRAVLGGTVGLVAAGGGLVIRGAAGSVAVAGSIVGTVAAAATAPLSNATVPESRSLSSMGEHNHDRDSVMLPEAGAIQSAVGTNAATREDNGGLGADRTSDSKVDDGKIQAGEVMKRVSELECEMERLEDRLAAAEALRTRAGLTVMQPSEGDLWERGRPGRVAWASRGVVRRLRLRVGHVIAGYVTGWVEVGTSAGDWGEAWVQLPATLPVGWWAPLTCVGEGVCEAVSPVRTTGLGVRPVVAPVCVRACARVYGGGGGGLHYRPKPARAVALALTCRRAAPR